MTTGAPAGASPHPRICVGISSPDDVDAVLRTLAFLDAHTDPAVEVVLLTGPTSHLPAAGDQAVVGTRLGTLPRWETARGGAAAFTRLVTGSTADVVVLLECGVLVGPGWLDLLLAALRRPGCGLAGPSTNRAWNEQAAARASGADPGSVRRDAARVLQRFGPAARSLAPLHSLGDFCYAVRREVVDVVGEADPAYGAGPCWEMDYNIRAARAGFTGLWVAGAWVFRPPTTAQRLRDEEALLARNRQLYQDRFCGLRLRGETSAYRAHCLGEACEHFAPAGLVRVSRPVPGGAGAATVLGAGAGTRRRAATPRVTENGPLISCIMPTRGRPVLAARAAEYFLRQGRTDSELLVVEDASPGLAALLPDDPRIRLVPTVGARSIGQLRNHACSVARGDILVEWDDDDWHGPDRLSRQVAPLLDGEADVTGLNDLTWFDLLGWRGWRLTEDLQRRMLAHDVYGGTLAFRRWVWEQLARFPDRSLAEDADFLNRAIRGGARLAALSGRDLYVYVRHGGNSWRVPCGRFLDPAGWLAVDVPGMSAADRAFYRALSPAAPVADQHSGSRPLVSCLMPTRGRPAFVPQAVRYFLRQDYPAAELVILDDGPEPVADLVPAHPTIRYHRLEHGMVLGAKRNRACQLATGDILAHWDDDDWQSPHRLTVQVDRLLDAGADVCGMRRLRFYDPVRRRAWRYSWPPQRRQWAAGTSLVFSRELWLRSPFPPVAAGEDSQFVWRSAVRTIVDVSDHDCVVALVHAGNSVTKTGRGACWAPEPVGDVEALLGADLSFYQALGRGSA